MALDITIRLIQLRRDTEANFTSVNPILAAGEPAYSTDTNGLKIGDGTSNWSSLSYLTGSGGGSSTWGGITGTLSNQTDLQSALDGKANTSHTHVLANITDLSSLTITESQITDLGTYLTTETDPVFTASQASNITAQMITDLGNLSGTNTGDQNAGGVSVSPAVNSLTDVQAVLEDHEARIDVLAGGGADGNGIYDGNGSLSATTTVNLNSNQLNFDQAGTSIIMNSGRLGVATEVFGPSRLGDSEFQAANIDVQSINFKDNSLNTVQAIFQNPTFTVTTHKNFASTVNVNSFSSLEAVKNTDNAESTLGLRIDYTNSEFYVTDLGVQDYSPSAPGTAVEDVHFQVLINGGSAVAKPYWFGRYDETTYTTIFDVSTSNVLNFENNPTVTGGTATDLMVADGSTIDASNIPRLDANNAFTGANSITSTTGLQFTKALNNTFSNAGFSAIWFDDDAGFNFADGDSSAIAKFSTALLTAKRTYTLPDTSDTLATLSDVTGNAWSDLVDSNIIPDGDSSRDIGALNTRFLRGYYDFLQTANMTVDSSITNNNYYLRQQVALDPTTNDASMMYLDTDVFTVTKPTNNGTATLGWDINSLSTTRDLIFTNSDITYNGTSLLAGGGSSTTFNDVFIDTPTGTIDGVNTTFTVGQSEYGVGKLIAFVNGIANTAGAGLTETNPGSGIFDFTVAPLNGAQVIAYYGVTTTTSTEIENRILNENKTLEVLLTSDRAIVADDSEETSGVNVGKRKFLTPNSTGSTVVLTLNDTPSIGDVITFSGNVQDATAILRVDQSTADIINLTGSNNAFTVSEGQLAMLRKLASNIYRIDGSYTEVEIDVTAPVLQSAVVENAAPSELVLTYNENLDTGSIPATTDFSVNDGAANAVTNVAISTTQVTLTLTNPIDNGDTVTVSYTAGGNPIQDIAGNDAINLTNESVTNNVAGCTPDPNEQHTQSNAASDPNCNEADATTGWSSTGGTLTSVADPQTGSFALNHVAADGSSDRMEYDFSITSGDTFDVTFWAKGDTGARLSTWNNVSGGPNGVPVTSSYVQYSYSITATATGTATLRFYSALSGSPGEQITVDNLSIIKTN